MAAHPPQFFDPRQNFFIVLLLANRAKGGKKKVRRHVLEDVYINHKYSRSANTLLLCIYIHTAGRRYEGEIEKQEKPPL